MHYPLVVRPPPMLRQSASQWAELRVGGLVDVSHAARTEMTRDFVMCEFGSDHVAHENLGRILSERTSMSFTRLEFAIGGDENESQCLINR